MHLTTPLSIWGLILKTPSNIYLLIIQIIKNTYDPKNIAFSFHLIKFIYKLDITENIIWFMKFVFLQNHTHNSLLSPQAFNIFHKLKSYNLNLSCKPTSVFPIEGCEVFSFIFISYTNLVRLLLHTCLMIFPKLQLS